MDIATSIKTCFQKYAVFSGRASRSEFWWFYLFTWRLAIGGSVLDFTTTGYGYGMFYYIASIAVFFPAIAAGSRRLHDLNKSGWWQLIMITIVGLIPLVIWWATEGEKKKNRFGAPINLK